mgnify:CR=1 FL=1
MSPVKHGNRLYKQMSLEVAVRNPERYDEFLKTFSHFRGIVLDDEGILFILNHIVFSIERDVKVINLSNLIQEKQNV